LSLEKKVAAAPADAAEHAILVRAWRLWGGALMAEEENPAGAARLRA